MTMKSLEDVKQNARATAVQVCRAVEAKLQAMLNSGKAWCRACFADEDAPCEHLLKYEKPERLQGLPNLATSSSPWHGLRVRAEYPEERLAAPEGRVVAGPKILCLDTYGRLMMVRLVRKPHLHAEACAVADHELTAEDGGHVTEAFREAIEIHLAHTNQSRARFEALTALNTALLSVLDGGAEPVIK